MLSFEVHVHPGARNNHVGGNYAGALVVRVQARAVDGEANEALIRVLGASFQVASSAITCVRGRRTRRKFVSIDGDEVNLRRRLDELLQLA
jgi:uncharacterized protein (TIGR00251 family)